MRQDRQTEDETGQTDRGRDRTDRQRTRQDRQTEDETGQTDRG